MGFGTQDQNNQGLQQHHQNSKVNEPQFVVDQKMSPIKHDKG